MKAFGEDVIYITEIFPHHTDDTEYLPRVGSEGWFLDTRDNRIRYRPAERTACSAPAVETIESRDFGIFTTLIDMLTLAILE